MFQNQLFYVPVKLLSGGGSPVTGVTYNILTMAYWRAGDIEFTSRTPLNTEWGELGGGHYWLKIPASLLSVLGSFFFTLSGSGFVAVEVSSEVLPTPIEALITPGICAVTGNLLDLGGQPTLDQDIVFRLVSLPVKSSASLITSNRIVTRPDALGNFSVLLLQGAVVLVTIDKAGINYQITVPTSGSATLLSLLPPIPPIGS